MDKAIIYNRVSTTEQNPELQIKDCEALAKRLNLIDYEIVQEQKSAFKDNVEREVFEKVKKEIWNGKIKHLIVWDLDRLYRNRIKLLEFLTFCNSYSVKVYSFRQEFLNVFDSLALPQGFEFLSEMYRNNFLQFLGWTAEEESRKKSERVKLAVRKEEGKITQSYKGNKWGRKNISIETKEAIIEAYKQNKPYSKICSEVFYWDKNRNKKQVSKGLVHKIITEFKQTT